MTADSPTVWLAGPEQAEAVAALLGGFRDHLGASSPSDGTLLASVRLLLERADTEFWLGATGENGPALGVCQLRFRPCVWTASDDCWLEDLFVAAEARRRGVGRALVQRAFARARERGCRRIELDTDEDNYGAIALYESLGLSARSKGRSRSLVLGARL
ncbi:MAG TPA: GNAT family N-acetyltransferase [Solirubrobacteraceae bacterium]|jgi:ribosomal protein S18 acetylase RimI-like enzyme|nr:GNAT family N-acetyltransferase [Solirubrobacteraceae bacterium]